VENVYHLLIQASSTTLYQNHYSFYAFMNWRCCLWERKYFANWTFYHRFQTQRMHRFLQHFGACKLFCLLQVLFLKKKRWNCL